MMNLRGIRPTGLFRPRPGWAFLLGLLAVSVWGQVGVSAGPAREDSASLAIPDSLRRRPIVDLEPSYVGFGVGERLVFDIRYGLIHAGEAVLEVRNIAELGGRRTYHAVALTRSNRTFSLFYKVRDKVETFIDTEKLHSRRFEKHLREGRYRKDLRVIFEPDSGWADYGGERVEVPAGVQDVLSALYYVRTLDLEVGKAVAFPAHDNKKTYPLLVLVHRRERVEVEAGTFDCLVVEPVLRTPGVFEQKGRLTVWVTDDRSKMPVLMKSKIIVGSISAELKEYTRVEGVDLTASPLPSTPSGEASDP
jgi:hypothetical protein